ncbi:MAG: magnesium-translocating P-type ATPase [Bradyrhizobiaceae bacterium]|nr:magnesium-translocating P-type ATPase [Bradyrhizobiaceae bacterium]
MAPDALTPGHAATPPQARLRHETTLSGELAAASRWDCGEALQRLGGAGDGIDAAEAAARLQRFGANRVANERHGGAVRELLGRARDPLNTLLLTLAVVSYLLGDLRAAAVIAAMVVLSIVTAFVQEHRSNEAAARLRALVKTTASVKRCGGVLAAGKVDGFTEIPIEDIVPGDVVALSAGDMIPADLRLLSDKDLFINQSTLTGEAMPIEKTAAACGALPGHPFDLPNICFMGSNVVSGYGTGVVVHTGKRTYFGQLADTIAGRRVPTSFEKGINRFTWLMIRFIVVLVPTVFLINGLGKGDWLEALLFALAVAVGLTPEMLPMIVTTNLAKGAIAMAGKQVIVKRLHAIQNFGAMDLLCTDKTGTLTQDRIILKRHLDIRGEDCDRVLEYAYLNSHYQSGLRNLLDVAVLAHAELGKKLHDAHQYRKIDEMPFDFVRRRLTVVLGREDGRHVVICKGAIEEVYAVCTRYEIDGEVGLLDPGHLATAKQEGAALNADGFRVIAVAYKELDAGKDAYTIADECDLTLLGYIAFLDPPKESAGPAIAALGRAGVRVKILTGDNDVVTRKVCRDVGLNVDRIILGSEVEATNDEMLVRMVDTHAVFAKVSPAQKARIIAACQQGGHVVGFLGDGINDSAALKAADVGISVDTAVDIAKESADIILLEKNLGVLNEGVIEGRKVFGNITKYIKMGASSNFGNMFSVVGASLMLPFLPMAPIQVLTNNLLYDFSQTAIPTDNVDEDYLLVPRRWDIDNIMKFMLFIGPISSLFDYVTYFTMIFAFGAWTNPALFQTGWFVESLLSQTLIIHVIRTAKVPFVESRASAALIATSIIICMVGVSLPFTWLGASLGFVPLPPFYWPAVIAIVGCYAVLTHRVKTWFVQRFGM